MKILKSILPVALLAATISAHAVSPASTLKSLTLDQLIYFVAGVVESTADEPYVACLPKGTNLLDMSLVVQRATIKYASYLDKPSSVFVRAALADMYCAKDETRKLQPMPIMPGAPEKTL